MAYQDTGQMVMTGGWLKHPEDINRYARVLRTRATRYHKKKQHRAHEYKGIGKLFFSLADYIRLEKVEKVRVRGRSIW